MLIRPAIQPGRADAKRIIQFGIYSLAEICALVYVLYAPDLALNARRPDGGRTS